MRRMRTIVVFWSSCLSSHQFHLRSTRGVFTGTVWQHISKHGTITTVKAHYEWIRKWFLVCSREVITTVELNPDVFSGLRVLLVHRWPRGVYLDPYQLASLSGQTDWQVSLTWQTHFTLVEINITNCIRLHYACINYCICVFTSVRYY